jgi:hypothetical protein
MLKILLRTLAVTVPSLVGCITEPGIAPETGAGRGTIVVWEKNGLHGDIYLDFRPTGLKTPDTIKNIPEGMHSVHLFYKDYAAVPAASRVEVREKRIAEAAFELQKSPSGTLFVKTEPAGATVSLNGIDFGMSPLLLEGLPAGSYTVSARLGNYRSPDKTVEVTSLARPQVDLTLTLATSVVIEYFSNTDCPGCPAAGAAIDALIASLPQFKDQLYKIAIHANWPAGGDPFFIAAKDDCKQRIGFYNVATDPDGLPTVYINGAKIHWPPNDEKTFTTEAKKRIDAVMVKEPAVAELSFEAISIDTVGLDSLLSVSGTLFARDTAADHRLFIALVEDYIGYPTPLGTNGQRIFEAVFRGFLKGANGVSIPDSDTIPISLDIRLPDTPPYQFSLIAFLQSVTSREIIQSQRVNLY